MDLCERRKLEKQREKDFIFSGGDKLKSWPQEKQQQNILWILDPVLTWQPTSNISNVT